MWFEYTDSNSVELGDIEMTLGRFAIESWSNMLSWF
jgi:hypothetical protein